MGVLAFGLATLFGVGFEWGSLSLRVGAFINGFALGFTEDFEVCLAPDLIGSLSGFADFIVVASLTARASLRRRLFR